MRGEHIYNNLPFVHPWLAMIRHCDRHETMPTLFVWIHLANQDNVEPGPNLYQSCHLGEVIVSISISPVIHLYARSSITSISLTFYFETRIPKPLCLLCHPLWMNTLNHSFLWSSNLNEWIKSFHLLFPFSTNVVSHFELRKHFITPFVYSSS